MTRPPPAAPAPVRLRLIFENSRLLRRVQRDEGLRRCWLLLSPELATVANLAAHVAARFRLRRTCPRGVVLSMDGFTLPPFESTCIFRDNDIIRVKQKSCTKHIEHNDVHCIQDHEIIEKRSLPVDGKILAIQDKEDVCKHQEEEAHDDHQLEENATASHSTENNGTSLKRKRNDGVADIPESSKGQRLKVTNSGKHIDYSKKEQNGSKKLKLSVIDIEAKKATPQHETTTTLVEQQKSEGNYQTELKCEAKVTNYDAQSDTKKNVHGDSPIAADCPSSSNQDGLPVPSSNQNGSHVHFSSLKADEDESETSDEIVPVVVRPGHIRFEPAGREPDKSPAKELQGTFQWSGTLSKKKGQKWGINSSNKKNADVGYHAGIAGSNTEVNNLVMDIKVTENGFCAVSNRRIDEGSNVEMSSVKAVANEEKSRGVPFDFESLYPLTQLPKEGDLIAYRLVELSSMLCPELSSFRVGKVVLYDPISLRIILLPVQEYPITTEENEDKDEPDMLVDLSPYKEDGSLEIEYSSLLDVRLLKGIEPVPGAFSTPLAETCNEVGSALAKGRPVTLHKNEGNIESQKSPLVANNTNGKEHKLGKSEKTVWEKNDEPGDEVDVQQNGWGTWKQNSTSAWSYRALRSSALGPTMALLRGKNNQRGKPPYRKKGK
ncbi:coilin isoform X7 [Zea mays]|uniref:Coilin n=1 Tax=Zea mays TaxID=4577 RepID=A0A804MGY7_MAIZE|nr:uncharacterized protein LOC100280055 isoform X7 [Zea mays]|eukprot:XP_020403259.1 uncharacterized protein LOC100280055 isoform X4 [Zea mays]